MGGGLLALTSDFVNPQVWLTAVVALQRPSRLVGASYFRFTDMPPNILVLIFGVLFVFKGAAPRSWGVDLYPDNLYPVHAPRTPISQPMASSVPSTPLVTISIAAYEATHSCLVDNVLWALSQISVSSQAPYYCRRKRHRGLRLLYNMTRYSKTLFAHRSSKIYLRQHRFTSVCGNHLPR